MTSAGMGRELGAGLSRNGHFKWPRASHRLQPVVGLTVFPAANHNAWDPAYRESGLAEWLLAQRR